MLSSEESSNPLDDLRVLDGSTNGVSMMPLCPVDIDLAALKVSFVISLLTILICFS